MVVVEVGVVDVEEAVDAGEVQLEVAERGEGEGKSARELGQRQRRLAAEIESTLSTRTPPPAAPARDSRSAMTSSAVDVASATTLSAVDVASATTSSALDAALATTSSVVDAV